LKTRLRGFENGFCHLQITLLIPRAGITISRMVTSDELYGGPPYPGEVGSIGSYYHSVGRSCGTSGGITANSVDLYYTKTACPIWVQISIGAESGDKNPGFFGCLQNGYPFLDFNTFTIESYFN
jgi:hypothetical protein